MAEQTTTPTALDTLLSGSKPLFGGNGLAYEVRPELIVIDGELDGSYDNTANTLTIRPVMTPTTNTVDTDTGRRVERLLAIAYAPEEDNARTFAKEGTATYVGYSAIRVLVYAQGIFKLLNTGALNGDRLELHVVGVSGGSLDITDATDSVVKTVNPGETFALTFRYVAADPGWYLWTAVNMTVGT